MHQMSIRENTSAHFSIGKFWEAYEKIGIYVIKVSDLLQCNSLSFIRNDGYLEISEFESWSFFCFFFTVVGSLICMPS